MYAINQHVYWGDDEVIIIAIREGSLKRGICFDGPAPAYFPMYYTLRRVNDNAVFEIEGGYALSNIPTWAQRRAGA